MSLYRNYTFGQIFDAEMKFDRKVELLENYVKRSSKKKPLILEHGCLNYRYSHHEVIEESSGNKILYIYDDTHKNPFFVVELENIIRKELYWKKDNKYNTLFIHIG